jgi:GNAT superfamily N-acetyltransferase
MTIELIEGTLDTASVSRIVSDVLRWMTFDPDVIEHVRATTPTWRDWIGLLDGEPVGVGGCGVSAGMEESSAVSAALCVLPAARHRGVGGTLYRRVSEYARELGREQLELFSFSDDPDCDGFAARHGFTIVMRARGLRLQLEDCPRPDVTPPAGVTITTLAERPDLGHGVWETAGEALPDIPYDGDVPPQPGTYEQFAARQLAGPRHIPEATFVALAREQVVGYGQLGWIDRSAGIADHEMLAVRRAWRGRGIAQSLKAAQIAWALDNGLSELRTGNEERNTAARAVNAHFPYTPMPDGLAFRGPCAAVE